MFLLNPYSDSSLEIIGSNTSLVANFGSTTGVAYTRYFGSDPFSNVGYVIGSSNVGVATDPLLIIGKIMDDSISIAPDIVIQNNNVGIGTQTPGYRLHVQGAVKVEDSLITSNVMASNLMIYGDFQEFLNRLYVESSGSLSTTTFRQTGSGSISEFYKDQNVAAILTNDGNLGIGISTPSAMLEVAKDTKLNTLKTSLILNDSSTNADSIITLAGMKIGGGIVGTALDITGGANVSLVNNASGSLSSISYTPTSVKFRVTNEGNVGIGTLIPLSKLQVADSILPSDCNIYDIGSTSLRWNSIYLGCNALDIEGSTIQKVNDKLEFNSDIVIEKTQGPSQSIVEFRNDTLVSLGKSWSTGVLVDKSRFDLAYGNQSSQVSESDVKLTVSNNGNVGIGTTNPLNKLHVNGVAQVDGLLYVTGGVRIESEPIWHIMGGMQRLQVCYGRYSISSAGQYGLGCILSWTNSSNTEDDMIEITGTFTATGSSNKRMYLRWSAFIDTRNNGSTLPSLDTVTDSSYMLSDGFSKPYLVVERQSASSVKAVVIWSSSFGSYMTNVKFDICGPATLGTFTITSVTQ